MVEEALNWFAEKCVCGGISVSIFSNEGKEINSIEDWFDYSPPMGREAHWEDGRSAKELAKAFFRRRTPTVPEELCTILAEAGVSSIDKVIVEKQTRLDRYSGPRHHDVVIQALSGTEPVVICIEAKVDEPFDDYIFKKIAVAKPPTNVPSRIDGLSLDLFGKDRHTDERILNLRYQLLTAMSGTVIEANNTTATKAIFLVYEFMTDKSDEAKAQANGEDLDNFVFYLSKNSIIHVESDTLYGPLNLKGNERMNKTSELYIGRVVVDVRKLD